MATRQQKLAREVHRKLIEYDNTLDNANLKQHCPLDNGRHKCKPASTYLATSLLDKLPLELLTEVLLHLDIPSLTRFRSVNRRAMQTVNSVHQYAAVIKHCPDVIRAIVSVQADAFDCRELYRTLSTSRCATCDHFGDFLYLIDCRRVCYLCFTHRVEYFPLTTHEASKFFTPTGATSQGTSKRKLSSRKLLELANPPSILSLPGRYASTLRNLPSGILQAKRLRLYDRLAIVQDLTGPGLPKPPTDRFTREPKRFMAIISAPLLLDAGRRADEGLICLGCMEDHEPDGTRDFRYKYTMEEMPQHLARYGPLMKLGRSGEIRHAWDEDVPFLID